MRDGHNGYGPSAGHRAGARGGRGGATRRAAGRSRPIACSSPPGTSEGIELALTALVDERRRSARADADLSALHGGAREDRRARALLPHRSGAAAGCRISIISTALVTPATRALVVIDPNNPTGATYPDADAARADRIRRTARPGDPRRRGVRRSRLRRPGRRRSAASIRMRRSSPSRACRRRISRRAGAPAGWRSAARRASTTSLAAIRKLADGRLCSTVPMQYAVTAALTGDRSHQVAFRAALQRARDADRPTAVARCRA